MKEIDKIKNEIERLALYFENFELRPPSLKINDFKKYYKNLTPEVIDFYNLCDGFNANTEDYCDGNIISLDDHLNLINQMRSGQNPLFTYQFPLLSDGCGNFDCIMFLGGLGNNSVIFWDSDNGLPSFLKASSLSKYISFLTEDLLLRYNPNGSVKPEYDIDNPNPIKTDWPFNTKKMILKDSNLIELYKDKDYALQFDEPAELIKYLD